MIRGTMIVSLCALIRVPGDHRVVRILCHREKNLAHGGKIRHRHDRGRGLPGSLHAIIRAGSGMALILGADDPGHRARTTADHPASRHLLGLDRKLLGRQHPAGDVRRADDRAVSEAARTLQVSLPQRAVLHLHRRLRRDNDYSRLG